MIKLDEYDTVINDIETYKGLADHLKDPEATPVIFAWTDQEGTQLDILMAYHARQYGHLQRGMSAKTDLFIGVSGCGFFGFELNGSEKYPSYVSAKLGLGGNEDTTTIALAELINGVCKELE